MVNKDFDKNLLLLLCFGHNIEAHMRANKQNVQQPEHETRGVGEGRTKQWGTETLGDLWRGEGWGGEHGEYEMDTTGTFRSLYDKDFQKGKQGL